MSVKALVSGCAGLQRLDGGEEPEADNAPCPRPSDRTCDTSRIVSETASGYGAGWASFAPPMIEGDVPAMSRAMWRSLQSHCHGVYCIQVVISVRCALPVAFQTGPTPKRLLADTEDVRARARHRWATCGGRARCDGEKTSLERVLCPRRTVLKKGINEWRSEQRSGRQDASEVQSGEHFFVACHLVTGVMPVLRVFPVPNYDYAGRSLAYAIAVLSALPIPFSVDGVSASTAANTLLLEVSKSASFTVHYHITSGHMSISALSGNKLTRSGRVAGDGGFTTLLAVGLAAIIVQPAPQGRATIEWTVQVGVAPEVRGFDPADGAVLKQGPRLITAQTGAPGQIVLDRKPVKSHYDAELAS